LSIVTHLVETGLRTDVVMLCHVIFHLSFIYLHVATHLCVHKIDICCLSGSLKPNSSGLQFTGVYLPALTVGGAAQLATAHCPNEQTLDPQ